MSGQRRAHLVVQRGDFLLVSGGEEEAAHLALQRVLHLHVDVVAGRLLVVVGVHANAADSPSVKRRQGVTSYKVCEGRLPDNVVDDDGVGGQQEVGETLRDLGELQSRAVKNLGAVSGRQRP